MSTASIFASDGRITIDIKQYYEKGIEVLNIAQEYRFFTILPFYNPALNENGDVDQNAYLINPPDDSNFNPEQLLPWLRRTSIPDYESRQNYYERWLRILQNGFGYYTFYNRKQFIDLFSYRELSRRRQDYIANVALGYAHGTNNPDHITLYSPSSALLHLLEFVPITVIFVQYNQNHVPININQQVDAIINESSFLDENNIYLELGIRDAKTSNPADQFAYNLAVQQIRTKIVAATHPTNYLSIFDARPLEDRDLDLLSVPNSQNRYGVTSLAGWLRYKPEGASNNIPNPILPPSVIYARIINNNSKAGNMFDSFVNKKYNFMRNYVLLQHKTAEQINRILNDIEDMRMFSNILTKIQNNIVFLSDISIYNQRNVLRYEPAARATMFGVKLIKILGTHLIGRYKNEELYDEFTSYVNNIFALYNNRNASLYVYIDENENQVSENILITHLVIKVGVTIYRIAIELVAT